MKLTVAVITAAILFYHPATPIPRAISYANGTRDSALLFADVLAHGLGHTRKSAFDLAAALLGIDLSSES